MNRWKRTAAIVSAGVTFATAGAVVASLTPAGAAAFRDAGNAIAGTLSQNRPLVNGGPGVGSSGSILPPMVITINPKAHLTSKLTVDIEVTVSCGPFVTAEFSSLSLQLSEAAGHTVAQGFGSLNSLDCDGSNVPYLVTADAQNVPFRAGTGLVSVQAFAQGIDPLGNFDFESQTAQSTVSIKK
jgi:hypothetical protein